MPLIDLDLYKALRDSGENEEIAVAKAAESVKAYERAARAKAHEDREQDEQNETLRDELQPIKTRIDINVAEIRADIQAIKYSELIIVTSIVMCATKYLFFT